MRVLDPILQTALDNGSYTPYFAIELYDVDRTTLNDTLIPIGYKLQDLELEFTLTEQIDDYYFVRLVRGITLNGINYTVSTSNFTKTSSGQQEEGNASQARYKYKMHMLPNVYYTDTGDLTYQEVIENFCTYFGYTAIFKNPADTWLGYQFLPTGRNVTVNYAKNFFNLLRQKYFVFACDNGNDEILFYHAPLTPGTTTDYILSNGISQISQDGLTSRQFISRDEANTVHQSGNATDPKYNLGFLPSTASHPTVTFSPIKASESVHAMQLKVQSGDKTAFSLAKQVVYYRPLIAEEVLDLNLPNLPWRLIVRNATWFSNTEGGALPSTIEAAAPYTPLNTSNFDNVLDENDNNIQAAMDTIDDHSHLAAESNATSLFQCNSPGGTSAFIGTINGAPAGAAVTYNVTSGTEGAMVPSVTGQLALMRLYNTTRGNSALIGNCNTGTNVITLSASAPANWANGDTITIASQTVSGGSFNWIDLEITTGPTGKSALFLDVGITSATVGDTLRTHPYETYGSGKITSVRAHATTIPNSRLILIKITQNAFSIAWTGTPTTIIAREQGYLP